MIIEDLSGLQIHKLTQDQYDAALAAGELDDGALYLTDDESDAAFTIVDDAEAYADYGAAEGYVLSPKAVKNLGMTSTGCVVRLSGFPLAVSSASSDGVSVNQNTGLMTINHSGYYQIRIYGEAVANMSRYSSGSSTYTTIITFAASPSTSDDVSAKGSKSYTKSNSTYSWSLSVSCESVTEARFLTVGTIITPTITYSSGGADTVIESCSCFIEIVRTNPAEAATS